MNKIERVDASLRGETVDRVPLNFFYHFPEHQRAGHAMAQAHLDFYRAADLDYLKVMNDNYYDPPNFQALTKPSEWAKLQAAPLTSRCFQDQLTGLREIVKAVGKEVSIITTVFNPFENGDGMSEWKATEHLKLEPEKVSEGLSTVADSLANFVRACIDVGASGIFFAAHGGQSGRHTESEFRKYIKPHDLTVLNAAEEAGAAFNLLHVCGENLRLQEYAEYPAHAVNWSPQLGNLSLAQGRRVFNRTITGGIDQNGAIIHGSQKDVSAEVLKAVDEMGTTGFMLGAGCALAEAVPTPRLSWVKQAVMSIR